MLEGRRQDASRPAKREITVRDLLSHEVRPDLRRLRQAGRSDSASSTWRRATPASTSPRSTSRESHRRPSLAFDPGTAWNYSRSTDVLGAVLEVASGKTLDVLLQDKIFTPARHERHALLSRGRRVQPPRRTAHHAEGPLSTPKVKQPMLSGGGGLNASTEDYFRFVEMLRGKGEYRGVRIIKPETLDAMLVNQIAPDVDRKAWFYGPAGGFGLGFGLLPIDMKDPSKGEYFSWAGYAGTNMWVDPKNDITTVFMIQNNEAAGTFDQRSWIYGGYASAAAPPIPVACWRGPATPAARNNSFGHTECSRPGSTAGPVCVWRFAFRAIQCAHKRYRGDDRDDGRRTPERAQRPAHVARRAVRSTRR